MKPWEYISLTHKDYVILCIGHRDRMRRLEQSERRLNYHIVKGWADPKKFTQPMEKWWPIGGEVQKKIRLPSKAKLLQMQDIFKNIGKKHG